MRNILIVVLTALFLTGCFFNRPADNMVRSAALVEVEFGHGSGVFVSKHHVLTAAHVVANSEGKLVVTTSDGKTASAEVAWISTTADIALIYVAEDLKAEQAYVRCGRPEIGETVTTVSNPYEFRFAIQKGLISRTALGPGTTEGIPEDVQQQMAITLLGIPGSSGGAVFDENGMVVGIMSRMVIMPFWGLPLHTGFSLVVPGEVICKEVAKHEGRLKSVP